jgi:hypothetical protein
MFLWKFLNIRMKLGKFVKLTQKYDIIANFVYICEDSPSWSIGTILAYLVTSETEKLAKSYVELHACLSVLLNLACFLGKTESSLARRFYVALLHLHWTIMKPCEQFLLCDSERNNAGLLIFN